MKTLLFRLGSPRLALLGMAALGIGAALSYGNPAGTPIWVLVVPLFFLAINLSAAITTNPRIYARRGLLLFHIGLLSIVVLAAVGRLTFFEAHMELLDGAGFDRHELFDVRSGVWHRSTLDDVHFVQNGFAVEYFAGLRRGRTYSNVTLLGRDGSNTAHVVGDDRPLIVDGYRFYTTYNKGFALVLTWIPEQGDAVTGAVHMPSYPLFAHKQDQTWTPPGGAELQLWLRLETGLDEKQAWMLDTRHVRGTLVVESSAGRSELAPGQVLTLPGGQVRFERLAAWMGYKVFYDPTLLPLFIASMLAVAGLFAHFWHRLGQLRPTTKAVPATDRLAPSSTAPTQES